MRERWVLGLVIGALGVAGCGGDSDDGGSSGAELQCNQFAETWCNQAMTCMVTLGSLPQPDYQANYDTCVRVATATVPCDTAVAVKSSYDQCLSDIQTMPCSSWDVPETELSLVTLPNACLGVILVE